MTTAIRKVARSPECTAATSPDRTEQHLRCAGNAVLRIPSDLPHEVPVQAYHCGCDCHTGTTRHTLYVGRPETSPTAPGQGP
ncbi:hypothetical protein [Actinacidiphila guanduensis]|uniref:Uncharacterized protein n=1 Tax=Actinacidiphila guanduensis TaxID=310781 RepID=A0A1H0Q4L0_9ACTN|nr:hypothetical protein [Actinacidiphila guanduensis]SDP11646.1 hypothetical protein SAMN05216259_117111 [Actinacidiphila guanduensis]